jgi:hypothetical protein
MTACLIDISQLPDNDRQAIIKVAEEHNAHVIRSDRTEREVLEVIGETAAERATTRSLLAKARVFYRYIETRHIFWMASAALLAYILDRFGVDTKDFLPWLQHTLSHGWGIK